MKLTLGNIEIEFVRRAGLISVFNSRWDPHAMNVRNWASIHLGVWPHMNSYYKRKGKKEVTVDGYWVWGRATETYDHCGEYFGLGPLLLVCW